MSSKIKKVIGVIIAVIMFLFSFFLFLAGLALSSEEENPAFFIVCLIFSVFEGWGAVKVYKKISGKSENKIYCSKCGKSNATTQEICFFCGANLQSKNSEKAVSGAVENKTLNIDGVQAKFRENIDVINIYEAKNADKETQDKLNAQSYFEKAMSALNGTGVPKDVDKALEYFELAANINHVEAQYWLGYLLSDGTQVKQDSIKGAHYLKMASDNGYVKAHYEYAVSLFTGCGVEKDKALGMKYARRAALEGYVVAQDKMLAFSLGLVPSPSVDPDDAEFWYRKMYPSIPVNLRALFEKRINFVRKLKEDNDGAAIQTISDGNNGVLYLVGGQSGRVYRF